MTEHAHTDCEELLGSLSAYIDGDLSPELCQELERHLARCDHCRVVLDTTGRTIDLMHVPIEKPDLLDHVRERLFKRLDLDYYLNKNPEHILPLYLIQKASAIFAKAFVCRT